MLDVLRMDRRQQWGLVAMAASAAAVPVARSVVAAAWRLAAGEEPPDDATAPHVDWGKALAWTAATAVVVALAEVAARRGAALAWERVTGERPPRPRRKGGRGTGGAARRLKRRVLAMR